MKGTLPFLQCNPSGPERQISQAKSSDFAMRAILALVSDFLAQRQWEILENRDVDIRVKSLGTAHQTVNHRMTALEALQRAGSVCGGSGDSVEAAECI
jgi:hypothetical protein